MLLIPDEILFHILEFIPHYLPITRSVSTRWYHHSTRLMKPVQLRQFQVLRVLIESDNSLELTQWAYDNNFEMSHAWMPMAMSCGNLDVADWLVENTPYDKNHTFMSIIKNGDFTTFEWAVKHFDVHNLLNLCTRVARASLTMTQPEKILPFIGWFLEHLDDPSMKDLTDELYIMAVVAGDLDIIKSMYKNNVGTIVPLVISCRWRHKVYDSAIFHNQRHIETWLHERGLVSDDYEYTFHDECRQYNIHVDVLIHIERLISVSSRWHKFTLVTKAVRLNRLDIVEWLHSPSRRYPIVKSEILTQTRICDQAKSLDMLKLLHTKGYPITDNCYSAAIKNNDYEMLRWLPDKVLPCIISCLNSLPSASDPRLFRWFKAKFDIDTVLNDIAVFGITCEIVIIRHQTEMIEHLARRKHWNFLRAARYAMSCKKYHTLTWILENVEHTKEDMKKLTGSPSKVSVKFSRFLEVIPIEHLFVSSDE